MWERAVGNPLALNKGDLPKFRLRLSNELHL